MKKQPKNVKKSIWQRLYLRLARRMASRASSELSRRVLERLWSVPGMLLGGSWPLVGRPGRPPIGFGVAFWRPKASPSVSGRVPETALGAQNGPGSIFRGFWVILGSIWHGFSYDFSFIFVRATGDEGTTSESQKRVARSSAHVFAPAQAPVCLSFEKTCEHYAFALLLLRTHKPT